MFNLAVPVTLVAIFLGTSTARAQAPPGSGLVPPPDPEFLYQRLDALEAQNALLRQILNDLSNNTRSMELRRQRPPVNEARVDPYLPGQLGRPLPPGQDRVEEDGRRPMRVKGDIFSSGRGFSDSGFGLYGYRPAYPYLAAPLSPYSGSGNATPAPVGSQQSVAAPAKVSVIVPDRARVWFDGKEAATKNGHATFDSSPISGGRAVTLSVKAEWDGSARTMNLPMQSGDSMTVDLRGR